MPIDKPEIVEALGKVHLLAGGSVAVACLSAETMRRFDATAADCEGVIDYLRDIESCRRQVAQR